MHAERHELYVYYRAPETAAGELATAVARMQAALRSAHPGLGARLLRRPLAVDGRHTWMEAYSLAPGSTADDLSAAIERAAGALAPLIDGPRHAEHFLACAS